ncbi:MAG: ABC transporter permease [Candidatus Moranbacteria bacterium]|jgi:ABC-type lipoprotein release transport system permease subunit|nr:ABC transporter permease [Candidatus Moranbacteria bacterium]
MHIFRIALKIATRDLNRSPFASLLTIAALAIASTAILSTNSTLNSFRDMLSAGARGWLSDIVILPESEKTSIPKAEQIASDLDSWPEIAATSVRSLSEGIVRYEEKRSSPYLIIGIDPEKERRVSQLPFQVIDGQFLSDMPDSQSIVLGLTLADTLIGTSSDDERPPIGDEVFLLSAKGVWRPLTIRGVIDAKSFFPNWAALLPKAELEKTDLRQRNAQIVIRLKNPTEASAVQEKIRQAYPQGIIVHTWEEESGYISNILEAVAFITGSIHKLLLVTIFIIVSVVMYINILHQRRQIGILKSLGAENRLIISATVFQAAFFSTVAYLFGVAIFALMFWYSNAHPTPLLIGDFRFVMDIQKIWSSFLLIFTASIAGSIIPSILSVRTTIVDILRNVI